MKALDLTGQKIGRLTAISLQPKRPEGTVWRWRCDCGTMKDIPLRNVRQGKTRSCGCLLKEKQRATNRTHGLSKSTTYQSWLAAKARCYRPQNNRYANYGARGVTMCDRWKNSFDNFLSDMGERPDGLTLDRIDPNGNYEPANCRWATATEQAVNKRGSIDTGVPGRSLRAYADEMGVKYSVIRHHLAQGRPLAIALERAKNPTRSIPRRKAFPPFS